MSAPEASSLFAVLADAARRRTPRGLMLQLVGCVVAAVVLLAATPQWWSAAALLGVPAAYAAWGMLTLASERRAGAGVPLRVLCLGVAATGTILSVAGILGLALALFTGAGRSPYNACGRGATTPLCRAWANPPAGTLPRP